MLYFEPPQPFFSSLCRPREGTKVAPNVTAFTLPTSIPADEEAAMRIDRRSRQNAAFIRRCMTEHLFEHPLLWLRCPDQVGLIYELEECDGLIYDCDRLWPQFPRLWESELAGEANIVFAASPALRTHLLPYSDNVAVMPNGVDYSLFSQAADEHSNYPTDLQRIFRPVFGYLGTVGDFTLLEPVVHAASAHPEWSFVFVGSFSRRNPFFRPLSRQKNVFFLGEKSLPSLPRYLSGFDVCFTLLDDRDQTPILVPEQLYRYLSSGKPIVAMAAANTAPFYADVVHSAHFDIEFISSCEIALEEDTPTLAPLRLRHGAQADWAVRGKQLVQILDANGFL